MNAMEADEPEFAVLLDTSGLRCPEPVMLLHGAIRKAVPGAVIKLVATDPSTQRDIPRFCGYLGHELVATQVSGELYCYFIRRGG